MIFRYLSCGHNRWTNVNRRHNHSVKLLDNCTIYKKTYGLYFPPGVRGGQNFRRSAQAEVLRTTGWS